MRQQPRPAATTFDQPTRSAGMRRFRVVETARRVLGLRRGNLDPVHIILAAQMRLRRWRRLRAVAARNAGNGDAPAGEVRRIVRARDDLLSIARRKSGR